MEIDPIDPDEGGFSGVVSKGHWQVALVFTAPGVPDIQGSSKWNTYTQTGPHTWTGPHLHTTTSFNDRVSLLVFNQEMNINGDNTVENEWKYHFKLEFIPDTIIGPDGWVNLSDPIYVRLEARAVGTGQDGWGRSSTADCGLDVALTGTEVDEVTVTADSKAVRYLKFKGAEAPAYTAPAYDIFLTVKSKGQAGYAAGEPTNFPLAMATTNVSAVISDRSVGIEFPPTFYRALDANGAPTRRPNGAENGNSYADTGWRHFFWNMTESSSASRLLGGHWSSNSNDIFNEWWISRVDGLSYYADNLLNEVTQVGETTTVDEDEGAAYVMKYRYRVTETPTGIVGNALGFWRIHKELEKVNATPEKEWKVSDGPTYLAPADFEPYRYPAETQYPIGVLNNTTGSTQTVRVTVTQSFTYTEGASETLSGGTTVDARAIELTFGASKSHSSEEKWEMNTEVETSFAVPANKVLTVYAVVNANLAQWRMARYAEQGYEKDRFFVTSGPPLWSAIAKITDMP